MKIVTPGEKVRQARGLRLLSQEKLGELTHTSRASIAGYETGRVNAPDDWVRACAFVLDIDEAWFTDGLDTLPPIDSLTSYEPRAAPPRGFDSLGMANVDQPFSISVNGVILQGTIRFQVTLDKVMAS